MSTPKPKKIAMKPAALPTIHENEALVADTTLSTDTWQGPNESASILQASQKRRRKRKAKVKVST
jgi:hypothetical protein